MVRARLRTVARLRAIAQRAEVGLGEWLDSLAGGEDVDPVESDREATRLSSIHTAKGREWRVVFLPGLEDRCYRTIVRSTDATAARIKPPSKRNCGSYTWLHPPA